MRGLCYGEAKQVSRSAAAAGAHGYSLDDRERDSKPRVGFSLDREFAVDLLRDSLQELHT